MEGRPFVNHSMLENHIGQSVSVIGKVAKVNSSGNQLTISMLDGNELTVTLKDTLDEMLQGIVQITGKVESDKSLTTDHLISFGCEDMEPNIYIEAVELTSRYPELFSYKEQTGISY